MITADGLTKSRVPLAIVEAILLYFGVHGSPWLLVIAALVQLVAEITDIVDGRMARKNGSNDGMGQLMDPAADRFLHGTIFFVFVSFGWVSVWLALIFFARETIVEYYRQHLATLGIRLPAQSTGKVKTVSQATAQIATIVFFALSGFGLMSSQVSYWLAFGFLAISAGITIYSFLDYRAFYKDATY